MPNRDLTVLAYNLLAIAALVPRDLLRIISDPHGAFYRTILPILHVAYFLLSRVYWRIKTLPRFLRENGKAYISAEHVYLPLPDKRTIRLLSIKPNFPNAPLECTLQDVGLDDNIPFTAISYTWQQDLTWKLRAIFLISFGIFSMNSLLELLLDATILAIPRMLGLGSKIVDLNDLLMFFAVPVIEFLYAEKRRWIFCNGRRMLVRPNLYKLMLQLRRKDLQVTHYWIDAICIDQDNLEERNRHVLLMADIYRQTEQVYAWLGPCPSLLDSPSIMGSIHLDHQSSDFAGFRSGSPTQVSKPFLRVAARLHFLSRDYFSRAWIIQEFLLPKKVTLLVGPYQFSPQDVAQVVQMTHYPLAGIISIFSPNCVDVVTSLLKSREEYQIRGTWSLARYVALASYREASNPRDLVYAGLGLVPRPDIHAAGQVLPHIATANSTTSGDPSSHFGRDLLTHPDYSATESEVYLSCAHHLLAQEGLYALSLSHDGSEDPGKSQVSLPSWIASFSVRRPLLPLKLDVGDNFSAGGRDKAAITHLQDSSLLLSSGGHLLDLVEETFDVRSSGGHLPDLFDETIDVRGETVKTIQIILAKLPNIYPRTQEPMLTALARTLIADGMDGNQVPPAVSAESLSDLLNLSTERNERIRLAWQRFWANLPFRRQPPRTILEGLTNAPSELSKLLTGPMTGVLRPDDPPDPPDDEKAKRHVEENPNGYLRPFLQSEAGIKQQHEIPMMMFNMLAGTLDKPYDTAIQQRCTNRSFFITKSGYIGLGSKALKKGDRIMVLVGADTPFAVRVSKGLPEHEDVRYSLMGEAYVHGIMNGELLLTPEWNPRPVIIE